MDRVARTYIGRTDELYVCAGCGRTTEMKMLDDARELRELEGGRRVSSGVDPKSLDPPLAGIEYRCPACGHAHDGEPARPT